MFIGLLRGGSKGRGFPNIPYNMLVLTEVDDFATGSGVGCKKSQAVDDWKKSRNFWRY